MSAPEPDPAVPVVAHSAKVGGMLAVGGYTRHLRPNAELCDRADHLAAIAAKDAEIARLTALAKRELAQQDGVIAKADAEIAALKADAERYRWLLAWHEQQNDAPKESKT